MQDFSIAWWNVENLFDVMPWDERARKIKNVSRLKKDLKDWNDNTLDKKLSQLASVITEMNNLHGPDILGVCEVENKEVLTKLVDKIKTNGLNRNYGIVHSDSPDPRGIDVAFIYDSDLFGFYIKDPDATEGSDDRKYMFSHEVIKRSPTRDLFQVNFCAKVEPKKPFVLIGNHWPSRISGTYETEPYRIIAAETLAYFNLRIQQVLGKKTPILVMGDFNDNPGARSLTDYALSKRNIKQVENARNPCLLNLMWPLIGDGFNSFWYGDPFFFDQFLVSYGFTSNKSYYSIIQEATQVICPNKLWENPKGEYPQPRRFSLKPRDPLGYSDHFPITTKIRLK